MIENSFDSLKYELLRCCRARRSRTRSWHCRGGGARGGATRPWCGSSPRTGAAPPRPPRATRCSADSCPQPRPPAAAAPRPPLRPRPELTPASRARWRTRRRRRRRAWRCRWWVARLEPLELPVTRIETPLERLELGARWCCTPQWRGQARAPLGRARCRDAAPLDPASGHNIFHRPRPIYSNYLSTKLHAFWKYIIFSKVFNSARIWHYLFSFDKIQFRLRILDTFLSSIQLYTLSESGLVVTFRLLNINK